MGDSPPPFTLIEERRADKVLCARPIFLFQLCYSVPFTPEMSKMKVLVDHASPFLLAHGGFQIQIEETKRALERLGVTVEYLRWWDDEQRGDIIHFFGRPAGAYVD